MYLEEAVVQGWELIRSGSVGCRQALGEKKHHGPSPGESAEGLSTLLPKAGGGHTSARATAV